MVKKNIKSAITIAALFAAVIYNIWPLGYFLDHDALQNSYVSVLEVLSKPYAWLFILADILTGLIVIAVGINLRKIKSSFRGSSVGYIVFGLATLLDTIVPITGHCQTTISACGISPLQILSFHDLASIVAALGLFYSLLNSKRLLHGGHLNIGRYQWVLFSIWTLCITGMFLVVSVVIDDFTAISQALFLASCGLGLVVIPASLVNMKE
jgi:hypothetical protein